MAEKLKAEKGLVVKEEFRDSVVTYIRRVTAFSVRLSDASTAQLRIIKELFPDYFEPASKETERG